MVLQTVAGDRLVVELSNATAIANECIGFKQVAAMQHPGVLSGGLLPAGVRGFLSCCRSPQQQHSTPWRLLLPRSTNPNDVGADKGDTLTLAALARLQFDGQADNPIAVVWTKAETSHSKRSVIPVQKMSSTTFV